MVAEWVLAVRHAYVCRAAPSTARLGTGAPSRSGRSCPACSPVAPLARTLRMLLHGDARRVGAGSWANL